MKYRYCTGKMAENAAKRGPKTAIRCSARKWWFYATCTQEQYLIHTNIGANCALCDIDNQNCPRCPLNKNGLKCRMNIHPVSLYGKAAIASRVYDNKRTVDNFRKFQYMSRRLAMAIERLKL